MTVQAGNDPPALVELPVTRGDPIDAYFRIGTRDDEGVTTYTNLTGATINAQIRHDTEDTEVAIELLTQVITPQTGANLGAFRVYTASDDGDETAGLLMGSYSWDCEVKPVGGRKNTMFGGPVPITPDTTRL